MEWRKYLFDTPKTSAPSPLIYREVSSKAILPTFEIIDLLLGSPEFFSLPALCREFSSTRFKDLLENASPKEVQGFGKKGRRLFFRTVTAICMARSDYCDHEETIEVVSHAITSADVEEVYRKCLGLASWEITPTTTHGQHPFNIVLWWAYEISPAEFFQWISALTNQCIDYFLLHQPTDDTVYAPPFDPSEPHPWCQGGSSPTDEPVHSNKNLLSAVSSSFTPDPAASSTQLQGVDQAIALTTRHPRPSGLPRPVQARKSTTIPSNKARILKQPTSPLAKQTIKASRASKGRKSIGTTKSVTSGSSVAPSVPGSLATNVNDTDRRRSARFTVKR